MGSTENGLSKLHWCNKGSAENRPVKIALMQQSEVLKIASQNYTDATNGSTENRLSKLHQIFKCSKIKVLNELFKNKKINTQG